MSKISKEAVTFLEEHKLAVLSTVSEKGEVWGAAIYFVVSDKLDFYFFTHIESTKYRNLKQHPQAAITVADDYRQTTVQASGKVTEIAMGEELDMAYSKLALVHPPGQFSWVPPVSKIHDQGKMAVMKFTPKALQFSEFKSESYQSGHTAVKVDL
jgi:nitroimidazol reductase NimA-like FMN-containing flavoprotein (pyridoxamine 5'-phosphate oxidase superfamily)